MPKFTINLYDQTSDVEVTRQGDALRVSRDGQTAEVHLLHQDGPAFVVERVRADGTRQRIRVAGYADGDRRQLWVNGRTFSYERVRQRGSGASADASLAASIPALVSQVLVGVGDAVTAGEKLILLESMKMVIPIQAPYDGIVAEIRCAAGDSVEAGVPLVELAPAES